MRMPTNKCTRQEGAEISIWQSAQEKLLQAESSVDVYLHRLRVSLHKLLIKYRGKPGRYPQPSDQRQQQQRQVSHFCAVPAKNAQPDSNREETSDKPNPRYALLPSMLNKCQVMEDKERLGS